MKMSYKWTNNLGEYRFVVPGSEKGNTIINNGYGKLHFSVKDITEQTIGFNGTEFDIIIEDFLLESEQPVFKLKFSDGKFIRGQGIYQNLPPDAAEKTTENIEPLRKGILEYLQKTIGTNPSEFRKYFIDSDLPDKYKEDLQELIR